MKLNLGKPVDVLPRRLYFNLWDDLRINLGYSLWDVLSNFSLWDSLSGSLRDSLRFNLWDSLEERG